MTARAAPVRVPTILVTLVTAALAFALAQTMIIPALPAIGEQYGATPETTTWLLTAFLLSASVCTPLAGRLGDIFGKGRMLLAVLGLFGIGLAVSAVSGSVAVLIAGRIVQGAGGAILPLAFGIVRDEFPRERVATSVGLISATFGVGGGLGLVLAGAYVDYLSVAWIFWSATVLTAAAGWATWRYVPDSPVRARARVDVAGAVLMSIGLTALLLAVSQGNGWGWTSGRILGLLAAASVTLVVFARYELGRREPLIDVRLLAERAMWTTNLATFAVGFSMFGSFILIPQLIQLPASTGFGFGRTATVAGLIMLPSSIAMLLTGLLSGRLDARYGSRLPLALGAGFSLVASGLLVARHATLGEVSFGAFAMGIGIGLALAAMANLVVETVRPDQTGVATGINAVMRTVGGAIGAQAAASLLAADTVAGGRFPAEAGFTGAFAMSGAAGLVALGAVALIPARRSGQAETDVPAAPRLPPPPRKRTGV